MTRAVWSPRSRAELDAYLGWVAERNPAAAGRLLVEMLAWAERIARHPGMGRASPVEGVLMHSRPSRSKIIYYRLQGDGIGIVAFRDARQDNSALDFNAQ